MYVPCFYGGVDGAQSTYLKGKLQHPGPHLLEGQGWDAVALKVVKQFHVQQVEGATLGLG
jgi:hypothetical protein